MSVFPVEVEHSTDLSQLILGCRGLPDLRFLAQLQSLRRKRMGSSTARRHDSRHSIHDEGLGKEGRRYRKRTGDERRLQRCIIRMDFSPAVKHRVTASHACLELVVGLRISSAIIERYL